MFRTPCARSFILTLTLLSVALFAACGSGGENARNGNAANANANTNTPAAASNQNASNTSTANTNSAAATSTAGGASKPKLNVNTASEEEFLAHIPGFGKKMAHEFEEYRPYRSIQQFRREIGKYVDAAQVAEYEKYVFVPIDENASDANTLRQIPGLDEKEAGELVAGRPYASREAFLSKLSEKVSADELAVARTYLSGR
jgi:DNA uptake protein ComE-like DNA-binding protein